MRGEAVWGWGGVGPSFPEPADTIMAERVATVKSVFTDQNMPFLQLWGPYPCIISPDESIRRAGVAGAAALVKLAAQIGVPASGVRPTSLNPRGDWWPHSDNYKPETEDRLVKSLEEILRVADDYGIGIAREPH